MSHNVLRRWLGNRVQYLPAPENSTGSNVSGEEKHLEFLVCVRLGTVGHKPSRDAQHLVSTGTCNHPEGEAPLTASTEQNLCKPLAEHVVREHTEAGW